MSDFFICEYELRGGERRGRVVGPADPEAFMRFVDVFREQGFDAAKPLFPEEWEWYDDGRPLREVLDLTPLVVSGIVLTTRAYSFMKRYFISEPHVELHIEGQTFHWLRVPVLMGVANDISNLGVDEKTNFCTLLPGAVHVGREPFAKVWMDAGLTGAVFTKI